MLASNHNISIIFLPDKFQKHIEEFAKKYFENTNLLYVAHVIGPFIGNYN